MPDMGQFASCQLACDTCPQILAPFIPPASMSGYLYSTQDIALCACNTETAINDTTSVATCEQRAGCFGGSVWAVWDNWLRMSTRNLRSSECDPLSIKCLESRGSADTLSNGECDLYSEVPLWDRPCSCIPSESIPVVLPSCDRSPSVCATLPAPMMVYELMSVIHGISVSDVVLNIKRNILDGGPVYAVLTVTQAFLEFYSPDGSGRDGEVFTEANSTDLGSHAVLLIGWANESVRERSLEAEEPLDTGLVCEFWWLRNSWTRSWGLQGYGKVIVGQDLMGIESGTAVAMMDSYEDWEPPVCRVRSWATTHRYFETLQGRELCEFELSISLLCSEEATLQVVWGSEANPAAHGTGYHRCPYRALCTISGLDLLAAGLGAHRSGRILHLQTTAFDRRSNVFAVAQTLVIEQLDSIRSVTQDAEGLRECGVPSLACSGCSGAAWPLPRTAGGLLPMSGENPRRAASPR